MKNLLLVLCAVSIGFAQEMTYFFPGGTYDTKIPTPQSVLGYRIGERFTDFRHLEMYLDKLVSSSDRVKRFIYGETNELRPLQALVISSPENLARLDEIKAANKRLTDPRTVGSRSEAEGIINDLPVIVYLSYGVHGNEACSTEAAMLTAYQLSAGTDEQTQAILEKAVVIIDPDVNPDGRERYVEWVNATLGVRPNANPIAIEHSEQWPGGRTNHYFFDLNRDWSWQTQKETRARVQFYRQWMPHVHVDYHEMGYASTYFFFPAAVPLCAAFNLPKHGSPRCRFTSRCRPRSKSGRPSSGRGMPKRSTSSAFRTSSGKNSTCSTPATAIRGRHSTERSE